MNEPDSGTVGSTVSTGSSPSFFCEVLFSSKSTMISGLNNRRIPTTLSVQFRAEDIRGMARGGALHGRSDNNSRSHR
jgi:hypothetical protein